MTMRAILGAAVVLALAGCGGHHATPSNSGAPQFEIGRPAPARPATSTLAAATGHGAHRLALWAARNPSGDLCVGWRLGSTAKPSAYSCQRKGLERPVLWVQGGGGAHENVDWGGDVGLVAPGVTRVATESGDVHLHRVPGLGGWRAFAAGGPTQPASELTAFSGRQQLLEDTGLWINPDGQGCDCGRNAGGWFGTYAYVPGQQRGDDAHALDATLGLRAVRTILREHGPAWIDLPEGWQKCTGGTIGEAVDLKLWHEASFFATLPVEEPAPDGTHAAYATGVHRVFASDSNELQAWVDTHTWQVVGVDTAFEHGAEVPLGTVSEPKPGGGYDDPASCPKGD